MKLIYIVGAGRSGSTLLDMMLGSDSTIFSSGELVNLIHAHLNGEYCSCGQMVEGCSFWQTIIQEWKQHNNLSYEDVQRFAVLDKKYSHPKSLKAWYCALFPFRSGNYARYLALLHSLLHTIQVNAREDTITDSSKSPVRLLNIMKVEGVDVKIIHLVKHPYGIIQSLLKTYKKDIQQGIQYDKKPKHAIRTSIWWITINLLTEFASLAVSKRKTIIKYEDLVSNPEEQLNKIIEGVCFSEPMQGSHICAGNRLRMQNDVFVQRKILFPDKPSFRERIILKTCKWWYGYK